MKGIESIKTLLTELTFEARQASHIEIAAELEICLAGLEDPNKTLESLKQLKELCNIKSLGDLNIESSPGWEWPNKVGRLSKKCNQLISAYAKNNL